MASQASTIRSASLISVVCVERANPQPWASGPRQTRVRTVELELVVERMLKGSVSAHRLTTAVKQSEPGPREVAVPGPWSGKSVEAGTRYVLFSRSDLAHADRVESLDSEGAVELALKAERERWPLGKLLNRAPASALNELMGEYVMERLEDMSFSDPQQFDAVLGFLESPDAPALFRQEVLSGIFSQVMNSDPAPQVIWRRLAVAGFRIAALKQAQDFRDVILSTLLPNLLGLTGGLSHKTANQVFQDFPGDRTKARAQASGYELLRLWLDAQ